MRDSDGLLINLSAYLTACGNGSSNTTKELKALLDEFNEAIATGRIDECCSALRACVIANTSYTAAQSLGSVQKKLLKRRLVGEGGTIKSEDSRPRIAILGSFTTTHLTKFIELALFGSGVDSILYEADYGTFRQEILDPNSSLYEFKPNFLIIATGYRDLSHAPQLGISATERDVAVEKELEAMTCLWHIAYERLGCQIIQNNFEFQSIRPLANYDHRDPSGLDGYIARVNLALQDKAPPFVTVHDVNHLAASVGGRFWGDTRFFHVGKLPCPPECLFEYSQGLASLISAHLGLSKKCLVLDLDNTLWGGVIGDDGMQGIKIGQGDAEGEAFTAFQNYVLRLKERGIILAVCSKNDEKNAKEPFESHPDMVLRMEDISCFIANWDDKASNIREIAKRLNIGLNSLVFVDDNPAERSIVRRNLPEVAVVELPVDASGYIQAVDKERYFQVVSLGQEDLARTEMYRSNAARASLQSNVTNMEEFLESLKMVATVCPIVDATLERSVQLINKSNQFNLTTRRYSTAEIMAKRSDKRWIDLTVSLVDCFGDNGLISVLLAEQKNEALHIDTWLMSCRVLKRGVEVMLLNQVVEKAKQLGLSLVTGEYIPTAKNGLVKDHYLNLGFIKASSGEDGRTIWELKIHPQLEAQNHFIKVIEERL
jgi:FkbH-like protein